MGNRWVMLYRFAWLLLIAVAALIALAIFTPKWRSLQSLHRERREMEAQNARITEQTTELIRKQQRFQSDPAFVARTAHESGRVLTNETVFVIPPGDGSAH